MTCDHDWQTMYGYIRRGTVTWFAKRLSGHTMHEGRVCSKCHHWIMFGPEWGKPAPKRATDGRKARDRQRVSPVASTGGMTLDQLDPVTE